MAKSREELREVRMQMIAQMELKLMKMVEGEERSMR